MSYFFSKTLAISFDQAVDIVTEALKTEEFGILTTIDVGATMKKKLGVEFPRYLILGACNPKLAHQALLLENKIGTMLPCNVIVRDTGDGNTEVAAVDPLASMQAVENEGLGQVAATVQAKLKRVISALSAGDLAASSAE